MFICVRLCDPVSCIPLGSSVHGILQARIPEWAANFLLQGIFPNQGSNACLLHLLHWQVDSLLLSNPGSPQSVALVLPNEEQLTTKHDFYFGLTKS